VIVADTNLIAYTLVAGPFSADAEKVLRRDADWLAPPLWQSEFLNVLWVSVRHAVITRERAEQAFEDAAVLVRTSTRPSFRKVFGLALTSGCSPYDCEFVALADAAGVPLVTADKKVLAAFPSVAVSIHSFA
jgi:predicted nucleic acid-binding protein